MKNVSEVGFGNIPFSVLRLLLDITICMHYIPNMKTYVCVNSWAGRSEYACNILEELKKSYRIELLVKGLLGNKHHSKGDIFLVPKGAIKFEEER
jgi:hypothetical protein